MRTKFELGEEVLVKARVIRISLDLNAAVKDNVERAQYDLAVETNSGNTISLNYIGESEIESVVQQ